MADPQNKWFCVAQSRTRAVRIYCMCTVTEFSVVGAVLKHDRLIHPPDETVFIFSAYALFWTLVLNLVSQ